MNADDQSYIKALPLVNVDSKRVRQVYVSGNAGAGWGCCNHTLPKKEPKKKKNNNNYPPAIGSAPTKKRPIPRIATSLKKPFKFSPRKRHNKRKFNKKMCKKCCYRSRKR